MKHRASRRSPYRADVDHQLLLMVGAVVLVAVVIWLLAGAPR